MHFTILLLLVCGGVFGKDEGDIDSGGEGPSQPTGVSILSHHQELGDDGTFKYSFSADNGLQQREAFHPDGSRTGAYSYVDPRGETVLVHYRADRFGFHVLDGSSIPTTPSLTGRQQGHPLNEEHGPETSSYEVEELDGESASSADEPSSSAAPRPFGFEMSRAPNLPGLHNRFYRSAARELFSEALVADQSDVDSIAAEDLTGAASSYHPYGLPGYVPIEQKGGRPYESTFASLARQIQPNPVTKGRAEAEAESEVESSDDGGREQAAATGTDNGDYGLHAGRYDDGSYPQHAVKYDDGSYPQHAVKYDDGSYEKYARIYGEGQYGEPSGQYGESPGQVVGDEDVGRAEYVRQQQLGEAHVAF